MSILSALRGIGGEYEIQRVLGGAGTVVFILCGPAFMIAGVIPNVSFTEFCLAYPAGLAACIGATAGAIALKDRSVATAKVTEEAGRQGARPTGNAGDPVHVTEETNAP